VTLIVILCTGGVHVGWREVPQAGHGTQPQFISRPLPYQTSAGSGTDAGNDCGSWAERLLSYYIMKFQCFGLTFCYHHQGLMSWVTQVFVNSSYGISKNGPAAESKHAQGDAKLFKCCSFISEYTPTLSPFTYLFNRILKSYSVTMQMSCKKEWYCIHLKSD
jgi:hypothetical protein